MDNALQALLSWQFILFCLSVTAITHVTKIISEFIFHYRNIEPNKCHWWKELVLPILPVILGASLAAAAVQYPYPIEIISISGRLAFGLCSGLLSGLVWRVVKSIIKTKSLS